jgi:hypothetical protein
MERRKNGESGAVDVDQYYALGEVLNNSGVRKGTPFFRILFEGNYYEGEILGIFGGQKVPLKPELFDQLPAMEFSLGDQELIRKNFEQLNQRKDLGKKPLVNGWIASLVGWEQTGDRKS